MAARRPLEALELGRELGEGRGGCGVQLRCRFPAFIGQRGSGEGPGHGELEHVGHGGHDFVRTWESDLWWGFRKDEAGA